MNAADLSERWQRFHDALKWLPVPQYDKPLSGTSSQPFCLSIKTIKNLPLPAAIDSKDFGDVELQVCATLYYSKTKKFFGNTFSSVPKKPENVSARIIKQIQVDCSIYFHTAITDPAVFAVVEFVAVTKSLTLSVGWAMVPLFDQAQRDPSLPIFLGSPRALFYLPQPAETRAIAIGGAALTYMCTPFSPFERAQRLVRENELVGVNSIVPGLERVKRRGAGRVSKYVVSARATTNLNDPQVEPVTSIALNELRVKLADSFERSLIAVMEANRALEYDLSAPDGGSCQFGGFQLGVGVHNGRTFVHQPNRISLIRDPKDHNTFKSTGSIGFPEYVEHVCFAVLVQLEAIVRQDVPLKPATSGPPAAVTASVQRVVPVGWLAWVPFDSQRFREGPVSVPLVSGPRRALIGDRPTFNYMPANENKPITVSFVSTIVEPSITSLSRGPSRTASVYDPSDAESRVSRASRSTRATSASEYSSRRSRSRSDSRSRSRTRSRSRSRSSSPSSSEDDRRRRRRRSPPRRRRGRSRSSSWSRSRSSSRSSSRSRSPTPPRRDPPRQRLMDSEMNTEPELALTVPPASGAPLEEVDAAARELLPPRPGYPSVTSAPFASRSYGVMSRADKARLYDAGFQDILDAHGNRPYERPASTPLDVDMTLEFNDFLQRNEIVLQFLAFTPVRSLATNPPTVVRPPRTLFFTFQFFRSPLVVTERLFAEPLQNDTLAPQVLSRMDEHGRPTDHKGLLIRTVGEGRPFTRYLENKALAIDVWDGDSLLQLGTVGVELKHLLRQGRESVVVSDLVFDVLLPEYDIDEYSDLLSGGLSYQALVRGRLHLRMANIGLQAESLGENKTSHLIAEVKKTKQDIPVKLVPKKMADKDPELAMALADRKIVADPSPELFSNQGEGSDIKRRKRARFELLKQQRKMQTAPPSTMVEQRVSRERDLKTVQLYREKAKRETIAQQLKKYMTTSHKIYASFGAPIFFELMFTNPYPDDHCFTVTFDDADLSLVTDVNEVRAHKKLLSITTPTETDLVTSSNKVFLRADETVYIPFKFLSYDCGQISTFPYAQLGVAASGAPGGGSDNPLFSIAPDVPIRARTVGVSLANQGGKASTAVEVYVQPVPFVIDKTFHFYNAENDFLKKNIRVHKRYSLAAHLSSGFKYLHCSNPSVIVGSASPRSTSDVQEVYFKYRCGPSPEVSRFYILLYNDQHKTQLFETWQIFVHALQRLDLTGIVGQTTKGTLLLRGTATPRVVQCYSSHADQLRVPSAPFPLVANTLNELNVQFRPITAGQRHIFINVVDVEEHSVVRAWLVATNAGTPAITKAFEIDLRTGKPSKKKLTYSNPYPVKKVFRLSTNMPHLMHFKEPEIELAAGEDRFISLQFEPSNNLGHVEMLVFINDVEHDKTEECLSIVANYRD
eukprot:TRINITY_DN7072_c0_g1_i1.p1 TRINITY_DN7072_c0_g1~~TRINITY_DN7072_c0_g1_i1.p1  ORF type:complete len:1412 (+),score=481.36 TRINITY_DN7072_c0_g1_i1:87-4322(+)